MTLPDTGNAAKPDNLILHCAVCHESQVVLTIDGLAGAGEIARWNAVKPDAEQQGWAIRPYQGGLEAVCPFCIEAEQNPVVRVPFSGVDGQCPKCKGKPVVAKWSRARGEHMDRACTVCGFAWQEAVYAAPMPILPPWWAFWK